VTRGAGQRVAEKKAKMGETVVGEREKMHVFIFSSLEIKTLLGGLCNNSEKGRSIDKERGGDLGTKYKHEQS